MKKQLLFMVCVTVANFTFAQNITAGKVPAIVKTALGKKYPEATGISWEKENGNYEANWGGRSGEDNAAQFTSAGTFVQIERAIGISNLPPAIFEYVKKQYGTTKIKEAGKVTKADGKINYEAEVKGSDLLFDEQGNFLKKD